MYKFGLFKCFDYKKLKIRFFEKKDLNITTYNVCIGFLEKFIKDYTHCVYQESGKYF